MNKTKSRENSLVARRKEKQKEKQLKKNRGIDLQLAAKNDARFMELINFNNERAIEKNKITVWRNMDKYCG